MSINDPSEREDPEPAPAAPVLDSAGGGTLPAGFPEWESVPHSEDTVEVEWSDLVDMRDRIDVLERRVMILETRVDCLEAELETAQQRYRSTVRRYERVLDRRAEVYRSMLTDDVADTGFEWMGPDASGTPELDAESVDDDRLGNREADAPGSDADSPEDDAPESDEDLAPWETEEGDEDMDLWEESEEEAATTGGIVSRLQTAVGAIF